MLVAQEHPEVVVHARRPDGEWAIATFSEGEADLTAIGCKLPIAEIYADLPQD